MRVVIRLLWWLSGPWRALERAAERAGQRWLRDAALAGLLAVLGAAAALVLVEPWDTPAPPVERLVIGEIEVPTGDARPADLVRRARELLQTEVALTGPGFEHESSWAELGAEVDMASLGRLLEELARPDSPAARYHEDEVPEDERARVPLPVSLVAEGAVESLVALKDMIDRKPTSARFNFAEQTVDPEVPGRSLDVYGTLARLDAVLRSGGSKEVELVVDEVPAKVTREHLAGIETDAVIGFYETPYSRMRKHRDRTHNLALGASLLDGEVIMPGEKWSFNGALGPRSEARGFRYAPVIAGGVLVEGMGGGTCQVASTLYAAAFFSGLVIDERQPHSRPSSYIKLGLDATVSYPDLDLKLVNPFPFPVVIHYTVDDGTFRAEFRGRERPYTVTLLRKVVGKRPFPVRVIEDSKLPRGEEVITQLGVPGYTVRRYKIVEGNKIGYRFQSYDKYPPTVQFVHKGISDPADLADVEDPPRADPHKPYRASGYLRMVQGPDDLWYEATHE